MKEGQGSSGPRVVHADNAGPFSMDGTRTHLVGRDEVAVIDAGPADIDHLQEVARQVDGARRVRVVVTHDHPDHDAGTAALVRILQEGREAASRPHPAVTVEGHSGHPQCLPLAHGAWVSTDVGPLQVLETPGHARRHLALFHEVAGDLYPGDLVMGTGRTAWVGSYGGCVADYLASLRRLEQLGARRLFPAHGPPVEGAEAVAEHLDRFRAHREGRIGDVAEALEALGADAPVDAMVDRVYGEALSASLRDGARWSVRAILHHLGARDFPSPGPGTVG
ncbi:MAG: MBL fold metallo-hydrolase [Gemmatimonadales bacterium]|nr:MAG: MBL fold metallo-hydrolase [Gemmatimonadales bacterium]